MKSRTSFPITITTLKHFNFQTKKLFTMKNSILSLLFLFTLNVCAYSQASSAQIALDAAKFGVDVTEKSIDAIWKVTGMDVKPYVHAFYVDVEAASKKGGFLFNGADGDKIIVYRKPKQRTAKSNLYHLTLLQPRGNWWKAITTHRKPNTFDHEIASVTGTRFEDKKLVDYADMVNYYVVLSKAKGFGVHTNMYWIKNSYDLTPDYDWVFYWMKD